MNEVIYKGLRLKTECNYFKVQEGDVCSVSENKELSTLVITYSPGSTSESISKLFGIENVGESIELEPTDKVIRIKDVYLTLNGLKLKKLTSDNHIIHIVIVNDSESRVIQDYYQTTIVVSEKDASNSEFIEFLFYSGNLTYLRPVGPKVKCWKLCNFPKIIIKDSDLTLESSSREVFTLRRRYDDYVIRAVDYQDQFILEMRNILEKYGLELVRMNKETTLKKTSYVTYQFSQTPVKINHPYYNDLEDRVLNQKIPIDFTLHTTDMVLFFDFKNKYNNVNLLTNFCEYKTMDKYGDKWTAAVKWGSITEDFNHQYQPDDNSNFSYQCNFRCELYFYEVFDEHFKFLSEIFTILNNSNDIV
jgi:hypothetical protein